MLAPLKHPLNILRHNLPHTLNLALCRPKRILLPRLRTPLLQHQPLERAIKTRAAIRRQVMEIRTLRLELCEEALLKRGEEAERDALAQLALRDDEEG